MAADRLGALLDLAPQAREDWFASLSAEEAEALFAEITSSGDAGAHAEAFLAGLDGGAE